MGLDLLDAPVRLTWDFPEENQQNPEALVCVARQISDAGVFFVSLQGYPLCQSEIDEVLSSLSGSQKTLVCNGSDTEMKAFAELSGFTGQVMIDVTRYALDMKQIDSPWLLDIIETLRNDGHEPSVALTPLRGTLELIPELSVLCRQHQLTKFKLPNANIGDSFNLYSTDDLPTWQDLREFSNLWIDFACREEVLPAMEIHDLFLWEIMTPGHQKNRSEYGGCQAANSLAHVDIHGVVHPCAAWPYPLGKLPEESLEDIWQNRARHTICEEISKTPSGCKGCSDLNICFGGCRGLAQHLNHAEGGRDLMCSGPRS